MRFSKFEITNFRGIQSATLDLSRVPNEAVNVLVGLNESGKTTVLEAINHFRSNPNLRRRDPNQQALNEADYQAMLPIGERALFNGDVCIKSTLAMDPHDKAEIDDFLKSQFGFIETNFSTIFRIEQRITFENSQKKVTGNSWSLSFDGRKKKGKTAFKSLEKDDWLKAVLFVEKMLPKVMYFPSSMLEFPDRIDLETKPRQKGKPAAAVPSKNSFYYEVLADVLKAID
jgi:AAA ATPase domain